MSGGDVKMQRMSASGALIPMSELAAIEMREGPARISREHAKRRIYIGFNVVGRDIGGGRGAVRRAGGAGRGVATLRRNWTR